MATAEDIARKVAKRAGLPVERRGPNDRSAEQGLAPWPQIDRYPTILGQGLSLTSLANAARLALSGYRTLYVDLLVELRHKDAHAISVLQKRVLSVANGRLEVEPVDADDAEAVAAADLVREQLDSIPDLVRSLAHLCWATYFGLSALENHWGRDGSAWVLERFTTIHSRRLNFPDQSAWEAYVWDQGIVSGAFLAWPTQGIYGLRIADYPGKFVLHQASLLGEYPTREGIGHVMATWSILKLIGARGAAKYLERFAQPWPDVSYATRDDGSPRSASVEDRDDASSAMAKMGSGSLGHWIHADSVKLDFKTGEQGGKGAKITFKDWLAYCDAEHSKAALGGTLTTEVGAGGGNRALGDTQKKSELTLEQYDAKCLAETIRRDVAHWIVALNMGPGAMRKVPKISIHVEDEPDPDALMERFAKAADRGMPVDADAAAAEIGVPVLEAGKPGRRLYPSKALDPRDVDLDLAAASDEVAKKFPKEMPNAFQQERGGKEAPEASGEAGKQESPEASGEAKQQEAPDDGQERT